MFKEHALVVLTREIADADLTPGDVGTVVHVYADGAAYEVEFVDGEGATVALLTLTADAIRELDAGELLHARRRAPLA
jgi:hypothetical protein